MTFFIFFVSHVLLATATIFASKIWYKKLLIMEKEIFQFV